MALGVGRSFRCGTVGLLFCHHCSDPGALAPTHRVGLRIGSRACFWHRGGWDCPFGPLCGYNRSLSDFVDFDFCSYPGSPPCSLDRRRGEILTRINRNLGIPKFAIARKKDFLRVGEGVVRYSVTVAFLTGYAYLMIRHGHQVPGYCSLAWPHLREGCHV